MRASLERYEVVTVNRTQLQNAQYNPRVISDRARAKLAAGIEKLGLLHPLTWNRRSGCIVGGHQRIKIMDSYYGRPDYELRVSAVDLDDVQEREANILMNNPEAQGDWDLDKLNELLSTPQIDISATGFEPADVYRLFGDAARLNANAAEKYADQVRASLELREKADTLSDDQSVDFYLVFVFRGEQDRDAFLERHSFDSNKFQSGEHLDAKLKAVPHATS